MTYKTARNITTLLQAIAVIMSLLTMGGYLVSDAWWIVSLLAFFLFSFVEHKKRGISEP